MNNPSKDGLIHDGIADEAIKVLTLLERPVRYQLVGSVKDYQGYDA